MEKAFCIDSDDVGAIVLVLDGTVISVPITASFSKRKRLGLCMLL